MSAVWDEKKNAWVEEESEGFKSGKALIELSAKEETTPQPMFRARPAQPMVVSPEIFNTLMREIYGVK